MNSSHSNISNVESFFDSILPKTMADKIFYGNLPKVIDSSWKTIVLVNVGTSYDRDAYATGRVLVYMFARPFNNGQKNIPALSSMEKALDEAVRNAICDHYAIRIGTKYSDYDTTRNLHCSIFSIELTIS